jgi:muramidase (phage lysozyme)
MNGNRKAFLDMIAYAEGTAHLGDRGYNVLVGGKLFEGYADHPRKTVQIAPKLKSSAAGRYQILMRYFDVYRALLGLPDFSPESQDRIAIAMIRECRALDDVDCGRVMQAVRKCRSRWASFPGAGYHQRERAMEDLLRAFRGAGGIICEERRERDNIISKK